MPRGERPLGDEDDVVVRFAGDLRRLREKAGKPSYRELGARAHVSASALSGAAGGRKLPSLAIALAYARACDGDSDEWEERWHAAAAELARQTEPEPGDPDVRAPYVGLSAFQENDADLFFGRVGLLKKLSQRLRGNRLVAVVGASGAGKTSLLRAGLLPELRAEEPVVLTMTPGQHPIEECAIQFATPLGSSPATLAGDLAESSRGLHRLVRQALTSRPDLLELVLIVDQFEEVFTLCGDQRERSRFIDLLVTAATAENSRVRIVLGIRADFYGHCSRYPDLVEVLQDHQVVVGPMSGQDLRDAITKPATRVDCSVESALLATLCTHADGEVGVLPLLSHALLETWRRRRGNSLSLAGFQAAGGIDGALRQTAEAVYHSFEPRQRQVAADLFLRLTALGEGTADTKRRITRAELDSEDADLALVLERLAGARLLTLDRDTVEIAHEALIRSWPRLREWLTENREALHLHRRLTEAAADWDSHDRDPGLLYRGARLAAWESRPVTALNDQERAFLTAGRAGALREQAVTRRRRNMVVMGLSCALVAVSFLAGLAAVQAGRVVTERDLASHREQVATARAELARQPELGLSLAVRAYDASPSGEAAAVLRQAVADSRGRAALDTGQGHLSGLAVSAGGAKVASAGLDGTVRIWDRAGDALGERPTVLATGGPVTGIDFSPDDRLLATVGADGAAALWEVGSGVRQRTLPGHSGNVNAVAFGPSGQLATGGDDGTVRLWDPAAAEPRVLTAPGRVLSLAFDPRGQRLAAGGDDRAVRVWPAGTPGEPEVLPGHTHHVKALDFSHDGGRLASAGGDGSLRVWHLGGERPPAVFDSHTSELTSVAFGPDGRSVVTGGNDGALRLWEVTTRTEPFVLRGHEGGVAAVRFSPDGTRLVSAGADGTVRLWDPAGGEVLALPAGHQGPAMDTAVTPDEATVVSGGYDGTVRVWRTGTGAPPTVLQGDQPTVLGVAVSADGRRAAALGEDRVIRVWDTGSGRLLLTQPSDADALGVALSPDGLLVSGSGPEGSVHLWRVDEPHRSTVLRGHRHSVRRTAFSPDGGRLVSASDDGTLRVWDVGTGAQLHVLGEQLMWSVEFSRDGSGIVAGAQDGTVLLWALDAAGPPVVLRGHQGMVWDVAYSPDGRWVASTGSDKTVRFWPVGDGQAPIVVRWTGPMAPSVTYGRDAQRLVSAHADGVTRLWTCEPCAPIAQVRALAAQRTASTGYAATQ
ncbi:nSTAND1 domain-containing NTPase [Amycolatopsis magusensis]|uniref:nSTAND1 domain-containing NTPase n=1 Tax=Amycolatopsis magusensis TaxID=882444 RepID=UPI0037B03DE4